MIGHFGMATFYGLREIMSFYEWFTVFGLTFVVHHSWFDREYYTVSELRTGYSVGSRYVESPTIKGAIDRATARLLSKGREMVIKAYRDTMLKESTSFSGSRKGMRLWLSK